MVRLCFPHEYNLDFSVIFKERKLILTVCGRPVQREPGNRASISRAAPAVKLKSGPRPQALECPLAPAQERLSQQMEIK